MSEETEIAADVNAETTADVPGTEESREKEPAKDEQPAESKGSDAPAGPSEKHDAEEKIELVIPQGKSGHSRIDEDAEISPDAVQSQGLGSSEQDRGSKSGKRSFRAPTPAPGEMMAIVKSPAFMLEDAHSPPAALLPPYGRTTSVGNATAAQLHAPTPAAPVKFTLGRVYDDTSKFDDLPMLDAPNSWRIAGIAVWGGSVVNGIRITYERGGVLRSSRELVGYDDGPHEWEQIELRPGEEIIKIEAVISFRIEKLTFRTSQSRHGTFGRGTEGQVHELSVPSEHRLVAFHGGVGGSLHTFGFWTLPLPTSFLSKDETPPGAGIPLLAPHERPGFIDGGRGGIDAHIPIQQQEEKGCKCTIQ